MSFEQSLKAGLAVVIVMFMLGFTLAALDIGLPPLVVLVASLVIVFGGYAFEFYRDDVESGENPQ